MGAMIENPVLLAGAFLNSKESSVHQTNAEGDLRMPPIY